MRYIFFQLLFLLASITAFSQVDQTYADYLEKRNDLLQKDSLSYFDHGVKLSEKEKILNQKILGLQRKMLAHYKATHFFPPARNFYASQEHVQQTELFKIIQKMPKGAMHHLHMSAMGDAEWVIERAIATPEMHVYWGEDPFKKGTMHAYYEGKAPKDYHPAYQLAKQYPAFEDSLKSLITFKQAFDQDSVDIWQEFEAIFQRIYKFVGYKPIFTDYITHGLQILAEDGIQHVELRTIFGNRLYDLENESGSFSIEDLVSILKNAHRRVQQIDPDFTLKVIYTNLRFRDKAAIWADMQRAIQLRKRYPEWIRGYDLVAEEDNGNPTLFHAKTFLKLDSLEQAEGIDLPLYLHDGESDWASVSNLYDAVLLGSKRIGHGFNLFRFPTLIELVKEKNICIEVNPLSNQILGYVRDLRIHPASTYLRRGVQISISSDDPLIFDYKGLSPDYWAIFMAWELDLAALKQLSRNGIQYSVLTEEEKAKALAIWEERWDTFVEECLKE